MLRTVGRRGSSRRVGVGALLAIVAVIAFTAACGGGGGGVTGPGGTPPVPVFRDGSTDAVLGATISPVAPALGATVHVEAAGYLPRDTTFGGAAIYLWPATVDYVTPLVFAPEVGGKLTRWTAGTFTIGLGDLYDDAAVRAVVEEAAAEGSAAAGLTILVARTGECTWTVDPNDPGFSDKAAGGLTSLTLSGSRITGAKTRFRARYIITGESPAVYRNNALHEVAHLLGLVYSPRTEDVTYRGGDGRRTQARSFGPGELVALRVMYKYRAPGGTAPDRDPGL